MNEGTPILQHLNTFNKILSNLLALEVKLEEEDKTLRYSLLFHQVMTTYDHRHVWYGDLRVKRC